jgi:hypothetical protein
VKFLTPSGFVEFLYVTVTALPLWLIERTSADWLVSAVVHAPAPSRYVNISSPIHS